MKSKLALTLCLVFFSLTYFAQRTGHPESFKYNHIMPRNFIANSQLLDYDVKFYHLDLSVSPSSTNISGNTLIKSKVVSNQLDTFVIQLIDELTVDSIKIDGTIQTSTHSNDLIFVILPVVLNLDDIFDVQVYYHGNSVGDGLRSSNYYGYVPWTTFTLSESFHAKEWFAVKEDLTDKADSVYVDLTVDNNLMAGSNGLLTNITDMGGGKVRYEWISHYPIDYYLISLSVSEYVEYSFYCHPAAISDSVLIQNYVYSLDPGLLSDVDQTADLIEVFSDLYGLYPFWEEKYGHCHAPLGGAMEHQTMTTTGYLDFWIVAHELGHQWFGDNVTCASWQDIWINEGFASYTEYLAFQNLTTQVEADDWLVEAHDLAMDEPDGSIYLTAAEALDEARIFSYELSYKKGASLVHMIRFQLNDDNMFFNVLRNFQNDFKDSVATGEDFKDFLITQSSMDFNDFFDDWYYGYGFPTYNVVWSYINDTVYLNVNQTTSSSLTTFFCNDMEYKIVYQGGDTTIRVSMTQNNQVYSIYLPENVTDLIVDPDNWILDGQGTVVINMEINQNFIPVSIFPNPAANNLNIEFSDNNFYNINLIDVNGKCLIQRENSNSCIIDLEDINSGIYHLVIKNDSSVGTYKIVKL
ncbi:MAG: M1 family aminopeptidase [Bacteroidota bacterium]